jgi:hypothetical protein
VQPEHRFAAILDQRFGEVGMGSILRYAAEVVVILLACVGAEVRPRALRLAQTADQRVDILDAVVDRTDRAIRETRVAAAFGFRGLFQHQHGCAGGARRERRAKARHAGANDHHIRLFVHLARSEAVSPAARLGEPFPDT